MSKKQKFEFTGGPNPTPVSDIINAFVGTDSLRHEDVLDLSFVELQQADHDNMAIEFKAKVKFGGQVFSDVLINQFYSNMINGFLAEAYGKRIGNEHFLTALSITFGSKDGKITPVYQSVYLKWLRKDIATQKDIYYVSNTGVGEHKILSGNTFISITQLERDRMVTEYKSLVKIVHSNGANFEAFISGIDVESVVIPLQAMYSIMYYSSDAAMSLEHALRSVTNDPAYPNKHIFMISGREDGVAYPIFYADRSHLCPPCSTSSSTFDFSLG